VLSSHLAAKVPSPSPPPVSSCLALDAASNFSKRGKARSGKRRERERERERERAIYARLKEVRSSGQVLPGHPRPPLSLSLFCRRKSVSAFATLRGKSSSSSSTRPFALREAGVMRRIISRISKSSCDFYQMRARWYRSRRKTGLNARASG